ncbi:NAD(P)H-dependent oxidoreductase [Clostridium sp. 'deep sea']|uniref:NAD(P)H-dependent oxidoreductase n=1 Tax=Clostridium sp. 'deep sea' TaxID=2779445 RepID=UPI00189663F3|nr:NAD(P)H-dependent oxidoreductase [Clostridium sp. 'deep sea']QOR34874.1 NAD(P)H-dependent oxidoreductase [Clostridium sp. 'deep sea']
MKTLLINGSPKGKNSTTEKFISYFTRSFNEANYDILRLNQCFTYDLNKLKSYTNIIFVMPLYIHAMPGLVMKFLERLPIFNDNELKVGFIIQYGFPEQMQASYLIRYFKNLSLRLNLNYIGTVLRGDAAGIQFMPDKKNQRLFNSLTSLGSKFIQHGSFDVALSKEIAESGEIIGVKKAILKLMYALKLDDFLIKSVFSDKEAYNMRFNQPYS